MPLPKISLGTITFDEIHPAVDAMQCLGLQGQTASSARLATRSPIQSTLYLTWPDTPMLTLDAPLRSLVLIP